MAKTEIPSSLKARTSRRPSKVVAFASPTTLPPSSPAIPSRDSGTIADDIESISLRLYGLVAGLEEFHPYVVSGFQVNGMPFLASTRQSALYSALVAAVDHAQEQLETLSGEVRDLARARQAATSWFRFRSPEPLHGCARAGHRG